MDWTLAIDRNREALLRIVAALVSLAELAGEGNTLPRHLHRLILRLLRPAESAVRRLIVVAARGVVVPAPCPDNRKRKRKRGPVVLCRTVFGVIRMRQRVPRVPAKKRSLPLFDSLSRWRRRRRPCSGHPRISIPGVTHHHAVPVRRPPLPDDPLDVTAIRMRLSALDAALGDLPAQARRLARWRAARDAAWQKGGAMPARLRRTRPLRPGRPPGFRAAGRRGTVHEVHELLDELHWLAELAMRPPDTS